MNKLDMTKVRWCILRENGRLEIHPALTRSINKQDIVIKKKKKTQTSFYYVFPNNLQNAFLQ